MPKLDATHIAERLRIRLAELEAGKEVVAKDIRALLSNDQMTAMEVAWATQQALRKNGRLRTDEEKQAAGWKTKRDIHIDAFKQAIKESDKGILAELQKLQDKAEIRQARIYFETMGKALDEGHSTETAKSKANNALTRAGLRRMDGANVATTGLTKRDKEIRQLEKEIKDEIRKKMTTGELEQQELLEGYESQKRKRIGL